MLAYAPPTVWYQCVIWNTTMLRFVTLASKQESASPWWFVVVVVVNIAERTHENQHLFPVSDKMASLITKAFFITHRLFLKNDVVVDGCTTTVSTTLRENLSCSWNAFFDHFFFVSFSFFLLGHLIISQEKIHETPTIIYYQNRELTWWLWRPKKKKPYCCSSHQSRFSFAIRISFRLSSRKLLV